REAPLLESPDERDHLRDIARRARIVLGALDAQELAVVVEGLDHRLGDLPDLLSLLRRPLDDLVVDVGQVHHLLDAPPAQPQDPPPFECWAAFNRPKSRRLTRERSDMRLATSCSSKRSRRDEYQTTDSRREPRAYA